MYVFSEETANHIRFLESKVLGYLVEQNKFSYVTAGAREPGTHGHHAD